MLSSIFCSKRSKNQITTEKGTPIFKVEGFIMLRLIGAQGLQQGPYLSFLLSPSPTPSLFPLPLSSF